MKPKLLIVDDSESTRVAVASAFEGLYCQMLEAAGGVEGLAVARREKPDLLLLDIAMPGMDGIEMLAQWQADPSLKPIPVMMLTGQSHRATVVKIARMGVRDFLVKPFTNQILIERVSRIINLHPKGEAAQVKRPEDPLILLLVDDKPAIHEQVKQALADTSWRVEALASAAEALDFSQQNTPDLVLASLALADDGAWSLFRTLRAQTRTCRVPVFALSVKTAGNEHQRALAAGFNGVVTKPVRAADLKTQVYRALNFDISAKYFEEVEGALILRVPGEASGAVVIEILAQLPARAAAAAESGLTRVLLDLDELKQPGPGLVTLISKAVGICEELTLDYRIAAVESVRVECQKLEEGKSWQFADSRDSALANWGAAEPALA